MNEQCTNNGYTPFENAVQEAIKDLVPPELAKPISTRVGSLYRPAAPVIDAGDIRDDPMLSDGCWIGSPPPSKQPNTGEDCPRCNGTGKWGWSEAPDLYMCECQKHEDQQRKLLRENACKTSGQPATGEDNRWQLVLDGLDTLAEFQYADIAQGLSAASIVARTKQHVQSLHRSALSAEKLDAEALKRDAKANHPANCMPYFDRGAGMIIDWTIDHLKAAHPQHFKGE